jgi:lipopolysaccharide transport system ATP-binding protein
MYVAISIQNVSKRYRLGEISRGQLLGDIHRWWMRRKARNCIRRDEVAASEPEEKGDFWALKDISFDIKEGETIGIFGANGAGKSTLLKIISRITAPTTGLVRIKGRVGSLLEVGTGFHPELTGRDNIYLNGAILGMNRDEVKRKFDDIVSFAGLEQFIDTPVKRYSSGMYVRLAFSVAAFLEPEILIVDEVLSVGDQQFQDRCIQRMEEIINEGRTLLFVSHGAELVRQVCRRAICLKHGAMIFDGDVDEAFAAYTDSTKPQADDSYEQTTDEPEPVDNESTGVKKWHDLSTAPGDETVKLQAIRVVDYYGRTVDIVSIAQSLTIEIDFVVLKGGRFLQPILQLVDDVGNTLFWSTDTDPELRRTPREKGRYKSSMFVPHDFLAPGTIIIHVGVVQIAREFVNHASATDVLSITVIEDPSENSVRGGYKGPVPGLIRPRMKWTMAKLANRQVVASSQQQTASERRARDNCL